MMKEETHIFQGLKRDNHQIRQDSNFLWDAHNIRLTNRDNSTLLSITNERGTGSPILEFNGFYVGHCVLGKYLIVFTSTEDDGDSWIYRVESNGDDYKCIILFHDYLGLNPDTPVETLGFYETELVQKVYWIDSKHQPRVINIVYPELKFTKDSYDKVMIEGVDLSNPRNNSSTVMQELESLELLGLLPNKDSFDFIQTLNLREEVEVVRASGVGMFSPGTIQYAFTYYNKYGAESNIFYTTPLQYISYENRAGNGEEKVSCNFTINISNLDNFDYLRIYSIHRTSLDAVPEVKLVTDIPLDKASSIPYITYTDTGTTGSIVDPTYLLYVGGRSIIAGCMAQKDGTLFFGNIELSDTTSKDYQEIIKEFRDDPGFQDWSISVLEDKVPDNSYYSYNSSLSKGYTASFKAKETYRCGLQVQDSKGVWSEPMFLKDMVLVQSYPTNIIESQCVQVEADVVNSLIEKGAKNIRSCVVFPQTYERERICQGVLCPTVYGANTRMQNAPYAMSSWFFRPAMDPTTTTIKQGSFIEFRHNYALLGDVHKEIINETPKSIGQRGVEIQSMSGHEVSKVSEISSGDLVSKFSSYFFVDENIVTFHSPDIELNENLHNLNWEGVKLEVIGKANLAAISGDIDIQTSTPMFNPDGGGFIHIPIGFTNNQATPNNGGLVSGLFFNDSIIKKKDDGTPESLSITNYMVYPWNRSGSLNNDTVRQDGKGVRSAVLSKKKISNLKFFSSNTIFNTPKEYSISTPQLFSSNEVSLLKVKVPYINTEVSYYGNVDTLLTQLSESGTDKKGYPIYTGNSGFTTPENEVAPLTDYTTDAIRMKYKSTPHLVFSLGNNASKIELLPRYTDLQAQSGSFNIPNWWPVNKESYIPDSIGVIYVYGYSDGTPQYTFGKEKGPLVPYWTFVAKKLSNGSIAYEAYRAQPSGIPNVITRFSRVTDFSDEILVRTFEYTEVDIAKNVEYLPGTTSSDYTSKGSRQVYKGKVKYYKLKPDATDPTLCTLEIASASSSDSSTSDALTLDQYAFTQDSSQVTPYVLLAELVREVPEGIKFGGLSDEAMRNNIWVPASKPVPLIKDKDIEVPYVYGDTWYGRYDCLKTYPFTNEDENQVIEIGSFLCESRVNLDGRWDKNRGQLSNLNMSPQNFNLYNEVYSQLDNFFNYRMLDEDYYKQHIFANQITWSKEKHAGEDIDTWTNITLANTLDMDGDKGNITALKAWNEYLLCFQDKALSQIMFNSRTQIPTTDGVPIEITTGYKVDGSRLFSGNIGCSNKWSIASTSNGVYFIDSNTDSAYIFNGQLANLSKDRGMDWWYRQAHSNIWLPKDYTNNGIRTFYDNKYGDIYFTPGPTKVRQSDALCYSEQLGQFTSLMSYGGTQAMFNFADGFYSLRGNNKVKLYKNNVGEFNNFYGEYKGWDFSFISNDNPTYTKIFDTVELRADSYWTQNVTRLLNTCPVSFIKASNEYQNADAIVDDRNMRKKFRVWRGLIPRNEGTRQRIRNPWSMITLGWTPNEDAQVGDNTKEAVIHDVTVKYTV